MKRANELVYTNRVYGKAKTNERTNEWTKSTEHENPVHTKRLYREHKAYERILLRYRVCIFYISLRATFTVLYSVWSSNSNDSGSKREQRTNTKTRISHKHTHTMMRCAHIHTSFAQLPNKNLHRTFLVVIISKFDHGRVLQHIFTIRNGHSDSSLQRWNFRWVLSVWRRKWILFIENSIEFRPLKHPIDQFVGCGVCMIVGKFAIIPFSAALLSA